VEAQSTAVKKERVKGSKSNIPPPRLTHRLHNCVHT